MALQKKSNTVLMRVPKKFKNKVFDLSEKYGFKTTTKFLDTKGLRIFENADALSDAVGIFFKRRKKKNVKKIR